MWLFIILIILTSLAYLSAACRKPKKFPPGPPKLPIVGSLPFLGTSLFHGVRRLVKRHGKVIGFFLGSEPIVVVSDYNLIKELLKRDETAGRPPTRPFNEARWGQAHPGLDGRSLGLVLSQGDVWKEQRRFVARNLRDFGFGKSSMEEMLHVEVEKLLELFSCKVGQATSMHYALNVSVLNALWVMLVGEKLELEDPRLQKLTVTISTLLKEGSPQSALALVLPSPSWLKLPILRDISGLAKQGVIFKQVQDMIGGHMDKHLEELDANAPNDLLDVLLAHVQQTPDPGSSFYKKTGMDSICNILLDLFIAGMETTSSTLVWNFFYMVHYPDIQEKVYNEINEVVGTDRLPSLTDQDDMPFTNAVLHESFRFASFVHLSVPHFTTKEIVVEDYVIPANCTLMPNLYHVMHDPDYWKNPEEYNPGRFIDAEGRFVKNERVVPFSLGKRYCLGQSLAEKELFLFFTAVVQKFRLRHVVGTVLPSLDVDATNPTGPVRSAPEYQVILEKR